jgi:hypothetical protein
MTTRSKAQEDTRETGSAAEKTRDKRPYKKPEVRHERVFEITALGCRQQRAARAQCALIGRVN